MTDTTAVLLKPKEAAARLAITVGTLASWRFKRRIDLPYFRIGRSIYYRSGDIDAFIAAHVCTGTGAAA